MLLVFLPKEETSINLKMLRGTLFVCNLIHLELSPARNASFTGEGCECTKTVIPVVLMMTNNRQEMVPKWYFMRYRVIFITRTSKFLHWKSIISRTASPRLSNLVINSDRGPLERERVAYIFHPAAYCGAMLDGSRILLLGHSIFAVDQASPPSLWGRDRTGKQQSCPPTAMMVRALE